MQLRERKKNGCTTLPGEVKHTDPSTSAEAEIQQPPTVEKKGRAEYQRDYRRRIKESKEMYDVFREHEKIRSKLWRLNRSSEVKAKEREQARIRAQRYRQKHKGERSAKMSKKVTRAEKQALQEKWREAKRKYRSQMSSQKRRRVNELRRQKYAESKHVSTINDQSPNPSSTGLFTSDSARRKAVSRSLRVLPKDPHRFAEVITSMVKTATPKKKNALKQRMILSPSQKKRLDFLNKNSVKAVIQQIKHSRSRKDLELRRLLHVATTIKNKLRKKTSHKEFGLSWNFLKKPVHHHLTSNRKKRTDAFNTAKAKIVTDFYNRSDITRELPLARHSTPVKVMECTGAHAFKLFREENPGLKISFTLFKKLRPADIKPMSKTKLLQCLCEYCINITFMLDALKQKAILSGKADAVIKNKYDAADMTLCKKEADTLKRDCIDRTCNNCGVSKLKEHLTTLLSDQVETQIQWKSWEMVDREKGKRMALEVKSGRLGEMIDLLAIKLEPFSKHLANSKWQAKQFDSLKQNVPADWVVLCMDFGENYNCHFQDEAQSAHWAYNQATIHPVVAFYNCPKVSCKEVTHESLMFISDDRVHDHHAVHHFVALATQHLSRQGVKIVKEIHFSDGAGSQYKNKTSFQDASFGKDELGCHVEKHFFGSRHGKGPCDGEIGVLKRCAGNAVKSRQVIIADSHDLFKFGRDYLTLPKDEQEHCHAKRTFFFVRDGEIDREYRKERSDGIKPVPKTRSFHCFRGVSQNVVAARERSCFCTKCNDGEYENCTEVDYTGPWSTYSLSSGRKVQSSKQGHEIEHGMMIQDGTDQFANSFTFAELLKDDAMLSPASPAMCDEDYQGSAMNSDCGNLIGVDPSSADLFLTTAFMEQELEQGSSSHSSDETLNQDVPAVGSFVAVKLYSKQSCSVYMAEADAEEQDHTKLDPKDIYEKPPIYKEDPDLEVPYPLLCGEHVIRIGKTADAVIILSKYRFFVKYKKSFTNIPVRLIELLEPSEHFLVIRCKDGKTSRVKFSSDEHCQEWFHILEEASTPPTVMTDFFAFCFHAWCFSENGDGRKAPGMDFLKPDNLFEYNFSKEVQRLGFNIGNTWKVYNNVNFKVSSTYPVQHIVPVVMEDDEIRKICKFRSKGRFPSVVWRHPRNGAVIVRCGQPEVGVFNWRCKEDEKLINSLLQACSSDCLARQGRTYMNGHAGSSEKENNLHQAVTSLAPSKRVLIVDLRSYASAYANKLKGGGYEYEEYYETSETIFMGLVNIHSIRKSFQSLRTICSSATESSSWLSKLESSEWLQHLSLLLKTAHIVVKGVHKDSRPVVIHCTDGWDRTTQIVGLAEIMLDPYYRTLEGIQVLIEREWLDFGHQFATRCGHDINENDLNGRSPVFLQWLDCLHQLLKQFPTAFEFNETFLIKLAEHVYSCLFGTFLCNTKRERLDKVVQENTCSVWAILHVETLINKNFLYDPNNDQVLHPSWNISGLHFWSKLFLSDGRRSEVEDGPTAFQGETPSIGSPKLPRTKSVDDIHKTASEEDGRRGSFVETSSLARTSSDPNLSDVRLEELVGTPPKGNYMMSSLLLEQGGGQKIASSGEEREPLLCEQEETNNSAVKENAVSSEPKEVPQVEYSLMQSVEQQQLSHELQMQSSTDTVIEETPRNAPSFGLCNGYHSEELSAAEHKDSNHNSENHLKLTKSSSVSTSTSDISNSHVMGVNGRLYRKRSFDILTDMGKNLQSRSLRGSQSDSETRAYNRESELAEISSSLFRCKHLSGPRSPNGTNCPLQIGRHLDEDGLTTVADPDQKRLVEIMLQLEAEKESMRRKIADLQNLIIELQCHDSWHDYHGLRYRTGNCEAPKSLTVEDDEVKPSSVPNSLHSDTSWDQLDDREANQTLWVPDHAVTHCECGTKFSLIHRKHHCRNCGKIFCSSCSNFFIAIPREQLFEPQRVCMTCHRSLQEQQPQSSRLCSSQTSLDEGGNLLKVVTVVGQG